jgi:hypothetical protein
MRCLVIFLLVALFSFAHATPLSDAVRQNTIANEAASLAAAEAGTDLDPADPRIKKIQAALSHAAKFFNSAPTDIANATLQAVRKSRANGVPLAVLDILRDGPALAKQRPSLSRDLAGFNKFADVYGESARFSTQLSEISAAKGILLFDPEDSHLINAATIDEAIAEMRVVAKAYQTDVPHIASVAIAAAKSARPVYVSPITIIGAAKERGVRGQQNLGNFMMFAASYAQAIVTRTRK